MRVPPALARISAHDAAPQRLRVRAERRRQGGVASELGHPFAIWVAAVCAAAGVGCLEALLRSDVAGDEPVVLAAGCCGADRLAVAAGGERKGGI